MLDADHIPNRQELRSFGLMFAAVLLGLFGLLIPLLRFGWPEFMPALAGSALPGLGATQGPNWPWLGAVLIALWAVLHPASLTFLYRPWMKFAVVAAWLNTRLIMLLLFYGIILPIGLLRRIFGKDSMRRRFEPGAESYRVVPGEHDRNDMEKPF